MAEGIQLAQKVIEGWSQVDPTHCSVRRLTGNSNIVYLIQCLQATPPRIIYRELVYGDQDQRQRSFLVHSKLAQQNIAPLIYFSNSQARLEQYLQNTRLISKQQFLEHSLIQKLSHHLKRFHQIDISNSIQYKDYYQTVLNEWISESRQKISQWKAQGNPACQIEDFLQELIPINRSLDFQNQELCLQHLDTCYLNFLYDYQEEKVHLIDFEYTGYSIPSTDLAMLIADLPWNYDYPQPPFVKYQSEFAPSDEVLGKYIVAYGGDPELYVKVFLRSIQADFFWGVWGLKMHGTGIMDMLAFGRQKLEYFQKRYSQYIEEGGLEALREKACRVLNSLV